MNNKAYHAGETEADNSMTPRWLINQLQDVTNVNIIHDVCATDTSAVSQSFWNKEKDALIQDWYMLPTFTSKDCFWMNPPFSLASEFTSKAAREAIKGRVTLGCVKHAPDSAWFQEVEKRATFIYIPDGRIQFLKSDGSPFTRKDPKTGEQVKSGANFPICFPLWTPFNNGCEAKQVRFKRDRTGYE